MIVVKRLRSFLDDTHGALNIVTVAITLPILILLATAAVDVIRLPIVEQQLQRVSLLGYDSLIQHPYGKSGPTESASGFNWCMLLGKAEQERICKPCAPNTASSCSGAKDSSGGNAAVSSSVEAIFNELTDGTVGVTTHNAKDLSISAAIYNILVDGKGKVLGKELVAERSADKLGAKLTSKFSADEFVAEKLLNTKGEWPGPWFDIASNQPIGAAVSVAVIHIEARIEFIFGFLPRLTAGDTFGKGEHKGKEQTLRVTLFRPLPRSIRLSGE